MPPQILFLGRHDWANVSHRVARGMNAVAGKLVARVAVLEPHPFGYVEDMVLGTNGAEGWRHWGRNSDWIISTGDGEYGAFHALAEAVYTAGQRRATAHVGSAYRLNSAGYNQADRTMGFARRFIGGDLFRFAYDDPSAVPYFAPAETVVVDPAPLERGQPVRVGHSPSNRATKGTARILTVFEALSASLGHLVEFDVIEGVSYREAAARRARCHVFVDQLQPEIGGYGASAVEALAAGCAVLSDARLVHPLVDRFYPSPPIVNVSDGVELSKALLGLVRDRLALQALRVASLSWAERWATPEAVGTYWLSHLAAAAH